jgi:hypothetical protein
MGKTPEKLHIKSKRKSKRGYKKWLRVARNIRKGMAR